VGEKSKDSAERRGILSIEDLRVYIFEVFFEIVFDAGEIGITGGIRIGGNII
jgi:hypothetical protein